MICHWRKEYIPFISLHINFRPPSFIAHTFLYCGYVHSILLILEMKKRDWWPTTQWQLATHNILLTGDLFVRYCSLNSPESLHEIKADLEWKLSFIFLEVPFDKKETHSLKLSLSMGPFVYLNPWLNMGHDGSQNNYNLLFGPRQANLVLIAYASSEGSGEPAHLRSLARTFAARSYKQWVKRNLQTESQIPGTSEWLGMRS